MGQQWEPERVVDVDLARELVESQFPELAPATVEPFGVGFDNTAYLVGGEIVFRFPRRSIAVPFFEAETRILPRIAPLLPLAVPVPRWRGQPTDAFPWPWAGYRRLSGRTACALELDDEQRAAAARPLGAFLAALHAIPPESVDAPGDEIHRADLERRKPPARERLAELVGRGLLADPAPWLRILDAPTPPPAGAQRLLHGDLYARHVLVDESGRPTGILDWGDIHAGDPAVDLVVAFNLLPARGRSAFLDAYGAVDDATWTRARVRAVIHSIFVGHYAAHVDDAPLLRAALRALAYCLE